MLIVTIVNELQPFVIALSDSPSIHDIAFQHVYREGMGRAMVGLSKSKHHVEI